MDMYKIVKGNTDKSFVRELLAPGFGQAELTAKVDDVNRTLTFSGEAVPCPFFDKDGLTDTTGLNRYKEDFSVTLEIPTLDSKGRTIDLDDVNVTYYAGLLRVNFNKIPVDNSRIIF